MCTTGKTPLDIGYGNIVEIDNCIHGLVKTLNDNGFPTVSSNCGRNVKPIRIGLKDGQTIIKAPTDISMKMYKKYPRKKKGWWKW